MAEDFAKGSASGTLGGIGDIIELLLNAPVPVDPHAQAIEPRLGGTIKTPQVELPYGTTDKFGKMMGADTDSTEFLGGSLFSPADIAKFGKMATLGILLRRGSLPPGSLKDLPLHGERSAVDKHVGESGWSERITGQTNPETTEILELSGERAKNMPKGASGASYRLSEIYDNPELFETLPQIANNPAHIFDKEGESIKAALRRYGMDEDYIKNNPNVRGMALTHPDIPKDQSPIFVGEDWMGDMSDVTHHEVGHIAEGYDRSAPIIGGSDQIRGSGDYKGYLLSSHEQSARMGQLRRKFTPNMSKYLPLNEMMDAEVARIVKSGSSPSQLDRLDYMTEALNKIPGKAKTMEEVELLDLLNTSRYTNEVGKIRYRSPARAAFKPKGTQ